MNQGFAAPVIQQPETPKKRKKNFCFATIPFIFIALIGFYQTIRQLFDIDWSLIGSSEFAMHTVSHFLYIISYLFIFIGAVFISALLFAKQNNALLAVPLFMFSVSYLLDLGAFVSSNHHFYYHYYYDDFLYKSFPTFWEYFKDWIPLCIIFVLASLGFFAIVIYIFIVTSRKKPAPKVLWIIPAILFPFLVLPESISSIIDTISVIIHNWKYNGNLTLIQLLYLPDGFLGIISVFAIILLLIWISFPYKKEKTKKRVQPVPASAPVQPVIGKKPAEHTQTSPLFGTVDISANTDNEITVDPEAMKFVSPVQPVAETKPEEDPERTIDYSYAERFYPPVNAPEYKPEPAPKPPVQPARSDDADKQRTNMQLLREYKELLDGGVITQEDYNKKKAELLGL